MLPAFDVAPLGNLGLAVRCRRATGAAVLLLVVVSAFAATLVTGPTDAPGPQWAPTLSFRGTLSQAARLEPPHVRFGCGKPKLYEMELRESAEASIAAAVAAPTVERAQRVAMAKESIARLGQPRVRSWYLGLLSEGLGDAGAVDHYAASARMGLWAAQPRLVELLEHPSCAFRSGAAEALADLRWAGAIAALSSLASEGGADDGATFLMAGCNSKLAAASALAQLRN